MNGPSEAKPDFKRNGRDRRPRNCGIGQALFGGADPVGVHEGDEVAVTKPIIDQPPQAVFGHAYLFGQRSDRQSLAPPSLAPAHHLFQPRQSVLVAGVDCRFWRTGGRRRAEERRLGLQEDDRAGDAEERERRRAHEFVPIRFDPEAFAYLEASEYDHKKRHCRQERPA